MSVDLSCSESLHEAAQSIARSVYPSKLANEITLQKLDRFLRQIQATDIRFENGPIDILLDEMDTILELDSKSPIPYPLMRELRHARQAGAVRLTISGRTKTKELLNDDRNPFAVDTRYASQQKNRLKLMELKSLTSLDSERLFLGPLDALGCLKEHERREALLGLARCGGIPFQIQNLGLDIASRAATTF